MSSPNITVHVKGGTTKVVTAPRLQVSGGGSSSNSFGVVNVATQNNITAVIPTDTLHVEAGTGILLTTNSVTSTLTIVATGGSATDQFARDQANSAFTKANTANVTGQAAFNRANSAYSNANTAIYTASQIRANISNTAPVNYDPSTGIISHALSGVVATTYGNTTFVPTITVDDKGHITSVTNTAIALPPSTDEFARAQANAAFNQANTANVTGQAAFDKANSGFTLATTANTVAASAYNQANIATTNADAAFARANAAYSNANSAIYTAAQIRANISNTAPIGYNPTTGVISLPSTANGQTLIGNTVSGAFDVATLTQGTGILITNDKGSITIAATGGSAIDQFARDNSNGAFTKANTANTTADAAFAKANSANVTGQAAFDTANSAIYTAAQIRANISNTYPVYYNATTGVVSFVPATANGQTLIGNTVSGTFDVATIAQTAPVIVVNGKGTITLSHASSGVAAAVYGNASIVPSITVDAFGHITGAVNTAVAIGASQVTSGTLAVARGGTGQTAITVNGSLLIGNTVSGGFDVNALTQGTGIVITNDKGSITIAATGGSALDQFARDQANAAFNQANTANVTGQAAFDKANSGFTLATTANTVAASAYNQANIATTNADAAFAKANSANVTGQAAFDKANSAIYTAAQIRANISNTTPILYDPTTGVVSLTTVPVTLGGTGQSAYTNGQILIGNTGSTGLDKATIAQSAPVIVTNLQGSITISHARSGVTAATYGSASLIPVITVDDNGHVTTITTSAASGLPAATANGQLLVGNTVSSSFDVFTPAQSAPIIVTVGKGTITYSHARSGVVAADSYGSSAIIPVLAIDANGHITAAVNTAVAISAAAVTSGILTVARGGTGKDATGLANGQLLIGNTVNTGFDLTTIAQTAPVIVVNGKGTITLSHASSTVAPAVYGGSNRVIGYTVDTFGHLTTATNVAIDLLDAGVITTGTLVVVRGGTGQSAYTNGQILIGNTGSTGLDKSTIAQTFPIIVTNTQGLINLSHASSGVTLGTYGGSNRVIGYTVDTFGHLTTASNVAIDLLPAAAITTGIISVARGGTGKDATGLVNGQILIGNTVNTGFDLAAITQTAPVIVSTDKGSIRLSHARSGVTAATYGSASLIPVITVDDNGHITVATTAAASGLPVAAANGQLLVGNTVSSSFDVYTPAQSAPIIVTVGKGTITYSHARSGVVALDSYGSGAIIPVLAIDANGHITAAVNTAVAISAAAITSGTLVQGRGGTGFTGASANGQTLIGNTVSGGFDLATLTAGTGININNLKGSIEIVATGGSATDQFARDTANGAFTKANGAVQTGFVTIVVAGQSDVVADSNTDTLTLVAGTNMTITTDAGTDTITLAAASGGGVTLGLSVAVASGYCMP